MNKNPDNAVSIIFGETSGSIKAVDHVFAVLSATYGAAWDRSLGSAPITDTKTAWGYQLSQFTHSNDAKRCVMWALQNLPDAAPSAIQFRNLCRTAPAQPKALELPLPPQNPEMVEKIVQALKAKAPLSNGFKDWAHRLHDRDKKGDRLSATQRQSYRDALGMKAA